MYLYIIYKYTFILYLFILYLYNISYMNLFINKYTIRILGDHTIERDPGDALFRCSSPHMWSLDC